MLTNYLKAALRNILKQRIFSFINIIGLATGMTAFLLIMQFVSYERNYDSFVHNHDNIYRLTLAQYVNNELSIESAENYPGAGPALVAELPEITSSARLYNMGYKNNIIITYEDAPVEPIKFKHRKFLYADSSFLPMMGYPMVAGDPNTALAEPNTTVISESYAKKYFGDADPLGKMLRLQDDDFNDELCKVTGVFKDLPNNTHLKFDILFSYKTLYTRGDWAPERYGTSWNRKDMYTYLEVVPGTNIKELEAKFPNIVNQHNPELEERSRKDVLALQKMTDIHLTSKLAEEAEANGDDKIVGFMMIIGIFIIVIAWVNYVNLSTAKAMERANEVGVRKVMGAGKTQLIGQYLMESAVINLVAIFISIVMIALVLPLFNSLSGHQYTFIGLFSGWFAAMIGGLWLVGTILSGLYPAFVMSGFKPVAVLKGKGAAKYRSGWLRKALVIFQFATSIALIAGTFIVYTQLDFMLNQDIGMNIDKVLVVERPGITSQDRDARIQSLQFFKNELVKHNNIKSVTGSVTIPGKKREYKVPAKPYGAADDKLVTLRFNSMDYQFIDAFDMKLLAGRAFSAEHVQDADTSIIVSESAAKLLGFDNLDDIIGQTLSMPRFRWNAIVVGVVNDYHQESLQKAHDPSIFYCSPDNAEFFSMKIDTQDLTSTLAHVEKTWNSAFPGNPFLYFFMDDFFNRQYENERKFGGLFSAFAILALIIGSLGLFGLSAFTTQQRTKEIGIRKILGSTLPQIFILLSKGYIWLILAAVAIASPLVYWIMNNWLNGFAYKIGIELWIFAVAGLAVLVVALLTISYQVLRAAHVNPADSLRYE